MGLNLVTLEMKRREEILETRVRERARVEGETPKFCWQKKRWDVLFAI